MDYVGLIFIVPFIAVCVWIIQSTRRNLRDYEATSGWRKCYWLLFVPGTALGVWLAFFQTLRLPEMVLHGLPVPLYFERLVADEWIVNELPIAVKCGAVLTDLLSGIAVFIFIFKIVALLKHFRKATES